MKRVDMSLVELVHAGEAWTHPRPPCCKRMIQYLERNEEIVTWVQVGCNQSLMYYYGGSDTHGTTAQVGDGAGPVPGHPDQGRVLHDEPADDEGRLVIFVLLWDTILHGP